MASVKYDIFIAKRVICGFNGLSELHGKNDEGVASCLESECRNLSSSWLSHFW